MNYLDFRKDNINRGCFNVHSLEASSQAAISTNLSRWVKEGLLIKLRQGWYTFPERTVSFADRMYCANNIYAPSYVSLFTALAYFIVDPVDRSGDDSGVRKRYNQCQHLEDLILQV